MNRRQFLPLAVVGAGAVVGGAIKNGWATRLNEPHQAEPAGDNPASPPPTRIRTQPVSVEPYPDLASLVPVARAADLLSRLTPCWYPIKTGKVMHAFRLWGVEGTFPGDRFVYPFSTAVLSGRDMLGYLLDDAVYRRFAPGASPLLSRTPNGVRIRIGLDKFAGTFTGGLAHPDDVLAACGEIGLPTTTVIGLPDGPANLSDVVRNSVAEFSIRDELEWTVEAFARYLDDTDRWTNQLGAVTTFDDVVNRLLTRPLGEGACLGTHALNALACLLRIDQSRPILSQSSRDSIAHRLKEASMRVTESRSFLGCWSGQWAPVAGRKGANGSSKQPHPMLAATGHHLEWMAVVPPQLRPEPNVIRLAVSGVLTLVDGMTPYERNEAYPDLTHLGRALSLMLRRSPHETVHDAWSTRSAQPAGNRTGSAPAPAP